MCDYVPQYRLPEQGRLKRYYLVGCAFDHKQRIGPKYQAAKRINPVYSAQKWNPRTGYRPINGSVRLCVDSLRSIHNETVNVYSHLVPATIALSSKGFLHLYFRGRYPTASLVGQLALYVYLTTSVLCLGTLSAYHTLLCHSEAYSDLWGCLDYVAIILQTIGSFASGIYVTFYCYSGLQKLY
ncbi:hypothetical protein ETB97_007425 [Aspergillus alliaceus]|uniref:Uncharacterized protein n=1 Tax=Petromyces alliaceus TaxID=209559 RepID=A0A8H6E2S5_PETAA|nr:hypothetical protein ETB97_007425 [Aspergillus burnettii]